MRLRGRLAAACVLLALLLAACGFRSEVLVLSAKQMLARAKPAIVPVVAVFTGHMSGPEPVLSSARLAPILANIRRQLGAGGIPDDERAIPNEILREVLAEPAGAFAAGPRKIEADVVAPTGGTGFIVSPDGYVMTNAHVVEPSRDFIEQSIVKWALRPLFLDLKSRFLESMGGDVPADILESWENAVLDYLAGHTTYSGITKTIYVDVGKRTTGAPHAAGVIDPAALVEEIKARALVGDVVLAGDLQEDVAVVKVTAQNLPTVPVGDEEAVEPGDRVHVVGYPGGATFVEPLSSASVGTPTVTAGVVSSKRPSKEGFGYIGTDAVLTHGNSGGPMLDSRGRVVGVVALTAINPFTQAAETSSNFAIGATLMRDYLRRANARPRASEFSATWARGLGLMDAGRYRAALGVLRRLDGEAPGYGFVQDAISRAQEAAS